MIVRLEEATDPAKFGGKAVQLGAALRAGLPVPPGYAVSVEALNAVQAGEPAAIAEAQAAAARLAPPFAVRSSAVGEDGASASFAGQHATVLNLRTEPEILDGLAEVFRSGRSPGALAYRQRKGIDTPVEIAAVIQQLVDPLSAGVLFTRHPLTGAEEFVIESAWGLGEAVVQGMVTPDHFRLSRDGALLEERLGEKACAIRCAGSGTEEVEVEPDLVEAPSLGQEELRRLVDLAKDCERHFGPGLDIEWAFAGGQIHLLQTRPITTRL